VFDRREDLHKDRHEAGAAMDDRALANPTGSGQVRTPLIRSRQDTTMTKGIAKDRRFAALMQAAQAGDARAYVQLLQEIAPRLRRIVHGQRRFLKIEDIEDLVQDVLLSLHAVRATYDPQRPFMPWLLAIARNRLADGARRYARRAAREVQVENLPVTFSDDGTNTEREVYRDPQALRQAIQGLPRGQRAAIEMLKLREMSLKEAATASGISIGALKVSVHRALVSLRKALGNEW
jgi:RNA polymerase sigma factor (sigma-70 family)